MAVLPFGIGPLELIVVIAVIAVALAIIVLAARAVGPPRTRTLGTLWPTPGWYSDPARRHGYRYWNGSRWTSDVSTEEQVSSDPL